MVSISLTARYVRLKNILSRHSVSEGLLCLFLCVFENKHSGASIAGLASRMELGVRLPAS